MWRLLFEIINYINDGDKTDRKLRMNEYYTKLFMQQTPGKDKLK
jgi:hypothetical protein